MSKYNHISNNKRKFSNNPPPPYLKSWSHDELGLIRLGFFRKFLSLLSIVLCCCKRQPRIETNAHSYSYVKRRRTHYSPGSQRDSCYDGSPGVRTRKKQVNSIAAASTTSTLYGTGLRRDTQMAPIERNYCQSLKPTLVWHPAPQPSPPAAMASLCYRWWRIYGTTRMSTLHSRYNAPYIVGDRGNVMYRVAP